MSFAHCYVWDPDTETVSEHKFTWGNWGSHVPEEVMYRFVVDITESTVAAFRYGMWVVDSEEGDE